MPDDDPGAAAGWARSVRASLALALVGVAVGAGLAWGNHKYVASRPVTACGAGCVTDGTLYFSTDAQMREIEGEIAQENASVRSGRYKTIVLLDPFTYSAGGTVSQSRMVDELAGALAAQKAVNEQAAREQAPSASPSAIQLLLANEGTSAEEGAAEAVAQIQALKAPDRIAAVAGMGLSVAATQIAAMTLAASHLPMFGAVTTADEFDSVNLPSFYQVVPDVESQVQTLLNAANIPPDQQVALIDSDQPGDIYSAFLRIDFTTALKPQVMPADLAFDPTSDPATVGEKFTDYTSSVCSENNNVPKGSKGSADRPPQFVLFAGRASSLPALIQVLQQSVVCNGQSVTILTGSDANDLPTSATLPSGTGGATVTVEYADIEAVTHLSSMFTGNYILPTTPNTSCPNQQYHPWAVATYDSVRAAATVPLSETPGMTLGPAQQITGATGSSFSFTHSGQVAATVMPSGQLATAVPIPIYQDSNRGCSIVSPKS